MMMVRNTCRKAVASLWSSTGIEHPRGRDLEKRHPSPNRHGHRHHGARHDGSMLNRMVLAAMLETSPGQRRPLQSPWSQPHRPGTLSRGLLA